MSKILIFGSNGQLAKSLLAVPEAADFELVSTHRPQTDLTQLTTIDEAFSTHQPQFVINAAAYTQVDAAETDQQTAFAVNETAVGHLAVRCAELGIVLLHVSTDYVYCGTKKTPYTETDPVGPIGIYGQSKLAGEDAIRAAACQHIILRTAWVYSPYGNNFVKTMLRVAKTRDQLQVVSDQLGCPTYAPHLASAILQIVQQLETNSSNDEAWGTYCLAGSGQTSWHGFAKEIFAQSAKLSGPSADVEPIPTSAFPTPAARPANSRMDCRKLQDRFGIRIADWQVGTQQCVTSLLNKN